MSFFYRYVRFPEGMPPRIPALSGLVDPSPFTTRAFPKDASSGLPRWDSRGHAEDGRMCVSRKINGHGTGELEGLESGLVRRKSAEICDSFDSRSHILLLRALVLDTWT